MNYQKKRKRQSGRQKRNCKPKYRIWIDEYAGIHGTIDQAIKDGLLPQVSFDPVPIAHFGHHRADGSNSTRGEPVGIAMLQVCRSTV